uniref:Saposin B-type domain-containing protein n=1 Tax=Electrophorus electricus TaxID=8005 RepID=A0A4W4H7C5_ELEEL
SFVTHHTLPVVFTFLCSSAWAMHLEYLKDILVSSRGSLDQTDLLTPEVKLPGACWACKWIIKTLKRQLGTETNMDNIKIGLNQVFCDQIGFLKFLCKPLVSKYMDVLTEELSTTDNPAIACANIGIC